MKTLLKSAKIINKRSKYHLTTQDILIEKGIIIKIAKSISATKSIKVVNLKNLHVSIGWFDTSVSFGEPGFEERENIENGLKVAAKSGFTAVALNPNTNPVIDNKSVVSFVKSKAANASCDLYPIGCLSKNANGKELAELYDMQSEGAIAFGDYNTAINNANLLKIALQYAQNFNGLVLSFPQNNSIANGYVNEDENSVKIGMRGIPNLAEELQISRDLFILSYTGGKLHIPSISTANAVKLIAQAKKKGLNITCSVAAHHLCLTDQEIVNFNTNAKVLPPLRTVKDQKALIKGLKDGVIDMITSDHNPIDVEHKKVEFENAKFGTIGLESFFGALNNKLDLPSFIELISTKPRERFGLSSISISEGEIANLTLFNPDDEYVFTEKLIHSTSKNAIFINKKLKGIVYGTYNKEKLII